jgi:hypothetical protein
MVLCRGFSWDESLSPEDRQNVEKKFYDWFDRLANEGKIIKRGHRLVRCIELGLGRVKARFFPAERH